MIAHLFSGGLYPGSLSTAAAATAATAAAVAECCPSSDAEKWSDVGKRLAPGKGGEENEDFRLMEGTSLVSLVLSLGRRLM